LFVLFGTAVCAVTFTGCKDVVSDSGSGTLPLVADYTYTTAGTPSYPCVLQFTDASTGSINSWTWSFDDGTANSAARHPHHVFHTAGDYTVSLTIEDGGAGTDTYAALVQVTGTLLTQDAQEVLDDTNIARAAVPVASLVLNERLCAAAMRYAMDMAENGAWNHVGSQGDSVGERFQDAGYDYWAAAENIASGYTTPASVVAGWMASHGHRANIENPVYEEMGLARVGNYWCQTFGDPQ
jgi:uncharacterized protein YkwD